MLACLEIQWRKCNASIFLFHLQWKKFFNEKIFSKYPEDFYKEGLYLFSEIAKRNVLLSFATVFSKETNKKVANFKIVCYFCLVFCGSITKESEKKICVTGLLNKWSQEIIAKPIRCYLGSN